MTPPTSKDMTGAHMNCAPPSRTSHYISVYTVHTHGHGHASESPNGQPFYCHYFTSTKPHSVVTNGTIQITLVGSIGYRTLCVIKASTDVEKAPDISVGVEREVDTNG